MQSKVFNLLHEPWIRVMGLDGQPACLSIREVFERAPRLKGLSGELPGQDLGILRLLLALLYAVFVPLNIRGEEDHLGDAEDSDLAFARWASLYQNGAFPLPLLDAYFNKVEEAFFLVHPERPFLQVPQTQSFISQEDGKPIYATEKGLGALIGEVAESGNKARLFPGRQDADISLAEAARWLVYLNSFDTAPSGTSKSGDGKTLKGFGLAWLGKLGNIWAEGDSLFDTLMFNLVLAGSHISWDTCRPAWKADAPYTPHSLEDMQARPQDLCALYSQPFRKVRLHVNDQLRVTGYQLWSGTGLDAANFLMEPMTVWAQASDPAQGYKPKLHLPARQLWRDFAALFQQADGTGQVPGVISWLSQLKNRRLLQDGLFTLRVCGITYTNNTTVDHVFSDALTVNAALLSDLGPAAIRRVEAAVQAANGFVYQLTLLMRKLSLARGDDVNSARLQDAVAQAFFLLDEPFRRWLAGIDPEQTDLDLALVDWVSTARGIVRFLGRQMVAAAGQAAFVGREVQLNPRYEGSLHKQLQAFIDSGKEMRLNRQSGQTVGKLFTAPQAYQAFIYHTADKNKKEDKAE